MNKDPKLLIQKKAELKAALLEIIDALMFLQKDDKEKAMPAMKKSLARFCDIYRKDYRLKGSDMRIRLKGRMMAGFMCSSCNTFPKTEALWRILHDYWVRYMHDPNDPRTGTVYLAEHPEKIAEFEAREKECIQEVDDIIKQFPIEDCTDYGHLVEAFDTMRYLAHSIFWFNPEGLFDPDWRKVNPWVIGWRMSAGKKVRSGKSMLVDYWWTVPEELRPLGHYVLEKLASPEITCVEDLETLRKEVLAW